MPDRLAEWNTLVGTGTGHVSRTAIAGGVRLATCIGPILAAFGAIGAASIIGVSLAFRSPH